MFSQVRHATDRPDASERNRHETNHLIEVTQDGGHEWKLAVVRGCNEQGLYTYARHTALLQRLWALTTHTHLNPSPLTPPLLPLRSVQCEPVEQNRHKQTGVEWGNTRWACSHANCRGHQLPLAALPLFCDR